MIRVTLSLGLHIDAARRVPCVVASTRVDPSNAAAVSMNRRDFTLVSTKEKTPGEATDKAFALLKQKGVVFDQPEPEDGRWTSPSD